MNHKDILLEIYKASYSLNDISNLNKEVLDNIKTIGEKIDSQKGVFTVLVTLLTHKLVYPLQDIRKHQTSMEGGFSGRGIDTAFITPTLKELGLPSMAESGWLTRSLEQPFPYNLDYNGKISNVKVKKAFLEILDIVQQDSKLTKNILRVLIAEAITAKNKSSVTIVPLKNPENLTIESIIKALDEHFRTNYHIHGGAKLPVLAFYSIYQSLIVELARYNNCELAKMGSHTASDRTSKSAGDIEIFKKGDLFEAIEIKLDKVIDITMVRIAIEKIARFNPDRYYILSYHGIKETDNAEIVTLIKKIKEDHGCQIIINGLLPTIKYYLRLLSSLDEFIKNYSILVENDKELKKAHKDKWNELIVEFLN